MDDALLDLSWKIVGFLVTLLLFVATLYIRRMSQGLDELALLVKTHDRDLAALKAADVIHRLNDHGNRLTELRGAATYQKEISQGLVSSLKEIAVDVRTLGESIQDLTKNCIAHKIRDQEKR